MTPGYVVSRMLRECFVASLLVTTTFGSVSAQTFPAKPIRIVTSTPGGSLDLTARVLSPKLAETLGQQFVIDNRGGAAGTIGADSVAKAPPDGYTLMVHSTTHVGNAHLYKKLPYDTLKDFTGVGLLSAQPSVLAVHPSLPAKSVKEFIALAKSKPKQILYATSGNGSAPHLSMALLSSMTGIELIHVPYKGGGPQVTALYAGEAQASLATIASVVNHIRSGKIRALGVTSAKPSKSLPGVPPIGETVRGYEMSPWIGVFAPAGTPKPIVDRVNGEINKVLAQRDTQEKLVSQALDPSPSTPDEMNRQLKVDYEKYAKLIQLTGAKIE
jgi:tripartite-type tricarboxylate transporter receptor subunit TctC